MRMNQIHYDRYINFIDSRKLRVIPPNTYTENHHVIPRSLGGIDQENTVILTAKEHFIAHMILWKTFGGKMAYAFNIMHTAPKYNDRYFKITSRQYEQLRIDVSKLLSELSKGKTIEERYGEKKAKELKKVKRKWVNDGMNLKMINEKEVEEFLKNNKGWILGGLPHSEETKEKMRKPHDVDITYLLGNNNPAKRPEVGKKISEANKGRKISLETRNKLSKNVKINSNYGMKGKTHSEVQKQKMSKRLIGIITINNGVNQKRVHQIELQDYLDKGWIKGILEKNKDKISKGGKGRVVTTEQRKNYSEGQKGMKHINNGEKGTKVFPKDLQKYLNNGWILGGLPRRKRTKGNRVVTSA